jgi:hypothetical protein
MNDNSLCWRELEDVDVEKLSLSVQLNLEASEWSKDDDTVVNVDVITYVVSRSCGVWEAEKRWRRRCF